MRYAVEDIERWVHARRRYSTRGAETGRTEAGDDGAGIGQHEVARDRARAAVRQSR